MIGIKATTELTRFRIRRNEDQIEVSQAAAPDWDLKDFQDLRAPVHWSDLRAFASYVECEKSSDAIYPATLEDYYRLLIFCAVRPTVERAVVADLVKIVLGLNGYDLTYWSMQFKRAFWSDSDDGSALLPRTVASFKLLFGLV